MIKIFNSGLYNSTCDNFVSKPDFHYLSMIPANTHAGFSLRLQDL